MSAGDKAESSDCVAVTSLSTEVLAAECRLCEFICGFTILTLLWYLQTLESDLIYYEKSHEISILTVWDF